MLYAPFRYIYVCACVCVAKAKNMCWTMKMQDDVMRDMHSSIGLTKPDPNAASPKLLKRDIGTSCFFRLEIIGRIPVQQRRHPQCWVV